MRFTVVAGRAAAAEARRRVEAVRGLSEEALADARIVLSELVTNSVLHAGLGPRGRIEVVVRDDDERLVIEVDDRDGFFGRTAKHEPAERPHGMGLKLLDTLCEYWEAHAGRVVASLRI